MSRPLQSLLPALDDQSDWLRVEIGRPTKETQVSIAQLASPGDGRLALALKKAGSDHRRPAARVGRDTFAGIAYQALLPQVITLSRQRRIPILDPASLGIDLGSDYPLVAVWDTARVAVVDGDPLAGEDDVEVAATVEDLHVRLVDWAIDTLDPVIEAVKTHVRVGRKALWGAVVDCFSWLGPDVEDVDPSKPMVELARFRRASGNTPLGMRVPVIEVDAPVGQRLQVGRSTCCFFYQEPVESDEVMPEHLRGPWERYCTTCPLMPEDETVRRLLHRLEQT